MVRFDSFKSNNPFRHAASHTTNSNVEDVPPPPGPPPSYSANQFDKGDDYIAPPPGPPPSQPQHNWQAVPLPEDTSGYPPPPDIFTGHDRSWSTNATEAQAEEGERWCRRYPLIQPLRSTAASRAAPQQLIRPNANTFSGTIAPPSSSGGGAGLWTVRTDKRAGDSCATVQPPVYVAARDDPRVTGRAKTVYYEVRLRRDLVEPAGVAVGFTALPYPPFRMPGWHRGSLAVHSDDGHRYVNDRWGGVDFVAPFARSPCAVGIGMRFRPAAGGGGAGGGGSQAFASSGSKGKGAAGGIEVECFFTRDGRLDNSWDINGMRDSQKDLEPEGVQGFHDLVIAVGTFEKTDIEVVVDPARWMYKDVQI